MKIRYNSHASITIEEDGLSIITDPWFYNPIYGGMMWQFPPTKLSLDDYIDNNYVIITHFHPDHFCVDSLKHYSKEKTTFLVPDGQANKRIREFLGKKELRYKVMGQNQKYDIENGLEIRFFLADNGIDSAQVITNKLGKSIFNMNDCFLSSDVLRHIGNNFNIEHAMIFFMGVGPYPGSFINYTDEEKRHILVNKKTNAFKRAMQTIDLLKCRSFTAYSNDMTWPRLSHIRQLNGCLKKEFYDFVTENSLKDTRPIELESGDIYDIEKTDNISKYSGGFTTRQEMLNDIEKFSTNSKIMKEVSWYEAAEQKYRINNPSFKKRFIDVLKDNPRHTKEDYNVVINICKCNKVAHKFLIENLTNIVEIDDNVLISERINMSLFIEDYLIGCCQNGFYTSEDLMNCHIKIDRPGNYCNNEEIFWNIFSKLYIKRISGISSKFACYIN